MKHLILRTFAVLLLIALCQSAHATVFYFKTPLSGAAELPPNASPATGTAEVWIDDVANTLRLLTSFSGLVGNVAAAHIHAPTATAGTGNVGVASQTPSFLGFPLGVTAGVYDHTFDLLLPSSYNASFITNNGGTPASAQAALTTALMDNKAYLNIHTTSFPAGEIRGFFVPQTNSVPDTSSTSTLLVCGLLGVIGFSRYISTDLRRQQ